MSIKQDRYSFNQRIRFHDSKLNKQCGENLKIKWEEYGFSIKFRRLCGKCEEMPDYV